MITWYLEKYVLFWCVLYVLCEYIVSKIMIHLLKKMRVLIPNLIWWLWFACIDSEKVCNLVQVFLTLIVALLDDIICRVWQLSHMYLEKVGNLLLKYFVGKIQVFFTARCMKCSLEVQFFMMHLMIWLLVCCSIIPCHITPKLVFWCVWNF